MASHDHRQGLVEYILPERVEVRSAVADGEAVTGAGPTAKSPSDTNSAIKSRTDIPPAP
jgi:hypothetical protein